MEITPTLREKTKKRLTKAIDIVNQNMGCISKLASKWYGQPSLVYSVNKTIWTENDRHQWTLPTVIAFLDSLEIEDIDSDGEFTGLSLVRIANQQKLDKKNLAKKRIVRKREARKAASELLTDALGINEFNLSLATQVELIDGGAWVPAMIFVAQEVEGENEESDKS